MTRILVECYEHQPSYELNVQGFKQFSKVIPLEVRARLTKEISPSDIEWCDVLLDIRGGNPLSAFVVNQAKKAGRKVFLSLDDDLMEFYPTSYEGNVFRDSLFRVMRDADCILTSSQYLGEKYKKKYGINYVVINTVVDREKFKVLPWPIGKEEIKLLYAAGSQHVLFFDTMIKPILNRLYDKYKESISLTIIGPNIDIADIKMRIDKMVSMPFDKYRSFMDSNHFDIGLAPLFDSEFCRSKYFNKYLEYSINSICGIYSNVMPYTLVVKNGVNGLLVDNDPNAWFGAICKLVDNPSYLSQFVINARKHILNNFSLERIVSEVNSDIPDLFSFKAEACSNNYCRFMKLRFLYYALKRRVMSKLYRH